jgi:hypothetical protein
MNPPGSQACVAGRRDGGSIASRSRSLGSWREALEAAGLETPTEAHFAWPDERNAILADLQRFAAELGRPPGESGLVDGRNSEQGLGAHLDSHPAA